MRAYGNRDTVRGEAQRRETAPRKHKRVWKRWDSRKGAIADDAQRSFGAGRSTMADIWPEH